MALILEDRVKVNTTTTGTGTVVLANTAPAGYQTFAVIGNANTTYYTIAGQTSDEWEVGIGTYYLANSSLSRDTILSSSAANAAVTFTAGTKDVFVTYPSEQAVYEDATGNISSYRFLGGSINNMTIGATTANTIAGTTLSLNNTFTSTLTGVATSGASQVYLNGATSNRIDFNQNGVNPPAVTTRSTGTKVVYFPLVNASATDYATGVETNTLWNSVPTTTQSFKWYANVTAVATLLGTGVLSTTGGFSGNGANLTALSATAITTGAINSIPVGNSTASTGAFTTLTASGNVNLDAGTFFVDATNNRVGVNTSSPNSGLASVINFGNAASTNFLAQANGTALSQNAGYSFKSTFGNTADFGVRRSADILSGFNAGNWGTEYLAFGVGLGGASNDAATQTLEKMRIQSNGNVGIGTAAPANLLDVQGASNTTIVARIFNANTNSATVSRLQLNAGTKITNLSVDYTGNYFQNQGSGGIVASYTDYDTHAFRNNAGANQLYVSNTASSVNYAQITGGITGVGPTISAQGTDGNVDIKLTPKGTGYANITSGGVKLGNSTIQDSVGNLVFTTGGANTTAFSIDPNQVSSFFSSIEEKATVSATAAAANVNLDAITQSILYYTSNATANTTINIRGSSTVPLNNILANGQSMSVVFMNTQGATAFYVNGYQIDGVAVVPKWQGGSAPTSGNALSVDTYSFTAIKTANATYTVLASQTQFK